MAKVFYIPDGPKNLAPLFGAVNWDLVDRYLVEIQDEDTAVVGTTPLYKNDKLCEDDIMIHFINQEGCVDKAIFKVINIEHETKAETFQVPTKIPLVKNVHGINRFNIKADEAYQCEAIFEESEQPWLMELYDTPLGWIEWSAIQGQDDDYLPIVLYDQKIVRKKIEDRFVYLMSLSFTMSHKKIIIRG